MPKAASQPAQASSNTVAVQQDWRDRDFVQGVAHGVAQLTTFLNDFEATTRGKLSSLNGKLSKLERRMQMVEATLQSVDQQR